MVNGMFLTTIDPRQIKRPSRLKNWHKNLPEELEELEEEEREPFEEPLEEEPLLESLLPPRFFFLSAAEASFALVRSRLLRLDAILKMGEQRRPSLCLLVDRNQFF